jgi:predicted AAA+ superfamily ATPase
MTRYYPRDITDAVSIALENMPVVVITGVRQTGKTTFLCNQPELGDRSYISFDDFAEHESAKSDPDGFIRCEKPLTIDEAHKCPEIFTAIKRAVDKKRVPGQFLLSGSVNFSVLKISPKAWREDPAWHSNSNQRPDGRKRISQV